MTTSQSTQLRPWQRAHGSRFRDAATIGLAVICCLASAPSAHAAPCGGSDLQGSVFHDFNADGQRSVGNTETGVFGAVVTAFSNDGSSASCETLGDGSFGIDAPGGFPVRLEVTLPGGATYDALRPGAAGSTSVVFAAAAGSGFDIGFNVPADFCQDNPDVMATCFLQGDPLNPFAAAFNADAIASVDYNRSLPNNMPNHVALGSEVGSTWGLGYQRSSDSFYAAAVLKRHSGLGPLGLGGIYRVDYSGGPPVVSSFVDVETLGVGIGTDPRSVPGEDPPGNGASGNQPGLDNLAYNAVGKVGLGDMDVEDDAGRLWLMSLGDGTLYAMDIGQDGTVPVAAQAFPLPSVPCVDGVFRPWAVESYRGRIYIGGVCSNETIMPYPDGPAPGSGVVIDFPNLTGHVYSMDPAVGTFSLDLTIPLNYARGCAQGQGTTSGIGCQWFPWTDLTTADKVVMRNSRPIHPTPILSDIEFSDEGDMLIGFTDRSGFQYGVNSPAPNTTPMDTSIAQAVSGGEMLRADLDVVSGTWTLEANGVAGGLVGAGMGNLQGPGGGEFFSAETSGHSEISQGGFAVLRGRDELVTSALDPTEIFQGGLLWMMDGGATPGAELAGFGFYVGNAPPTFAKGVGMGDVVLRCDAAPVEIGNRVWCDLSAPGGVADGIQNPGTPDSALSGVMVDLSCDGGAVTASTMTAADGTYLFDDANVVGGIPTGVSCTVSIDTSQGALGQCNVPTLLDAGGADPGSDLRDSDGADPDMDGIVEATVAVSGPGDNDHSLDFGFIVPGLGAIGDTVWCDGFEGFGNGVFDSGEGVSGVSVELFVDGNCDDMADGAAIAAQSTTGDGQYLFSNLIVGLPGSEVCYVVRVDATDAQLGSCNTPLTPIEYGPDLDTNMPQDLDNDFGFVEPLGVGSIGDTVWCDGFDIFGNGVFDSGEGVAGVEVRLFEDPNCDDVADGAAIATQTTVGDGQYQFTDLPIGPIATPLCYVVEVDATDAELDGCNLPITPISLAPDLDKGTPDRDTVDFGFERPCDDSDGDRVCNESCIEDRDGDGIADCDDPDPQGYLYCEDTGEILSGGSVEVVGPGDVTLFEDGSSGRYAFVTDGTAGTYTLVVTPPQDFPMSPACPDLGILDPTGAGNPFSLGAGEQQSSGFLTSEQCLDNPFYLAFDLENGDPLVINNNIPLASCEVPVVEVPTLSQWSLGLLALLLAVGGVAVTRRRAP